ncbi:unnamed protein product [Durusdinium trenchii]|uniref:Uncharacterized protein n=1 Tax=Durusdinium trenchii TaxID=1381693 RepID=A0ABP0T2Z8_9DINO
MVLKMADLDSGLGDRDVKQAFSQLAQANGMADEDDPRPEEEVKGAGKPPEHPVLLWLHVGCHAVPGSPGKQSLDMQAANGEAPPAPIEEGSLVKHALYGNGVQDPLNDMVAAHHAPRSLSGLAREEDEHGDEREFTECIAAWQETGGRTFPDFGRIVSRSPGHSHRSQDVEVRGELNATCH